MELSEGYLLAVFISGVKLINCHLFLDDSSLRSSATDESPMEQPPLRRPLPWLLFLPTVCLLRLFREGISLLATMRGDEPIGPHEMVQYLRNVRRDIRAVRFDGLRTIRELEEHQHNAFETMGLIGRMLFFLGKALYSGKSAGHVKQQSKVTFYPYWFQILIQI